MIAIDAMGGDSAPQATVTGAWRVAKRGVPVSLFGHQLQIIRLLDTLDTQWRELPISVVHCTQRIGMADEPGRTVVAKKDASLVRAIQAVADGEADAVVSAGNSGASLIAGTLLLGRVDGVLRPAIGGQLPTEHGSLFCMDIGANTDCKPEYLHQFGLMGHAYAKIINGVANPRVALLSNGAEPYKGSFVVKKAYELLKNSPLNFIGNLEARSIFDGRADVLVCDGFVGNVLLKSIQGTKRAIFSAFKKESMRSWFDKLVAWLNRSLFSRLKKSTDYARAGGALLLGVKKPLVVAHGCSDAHAIEQAILFAHDVVSKKKVTRWAQELARLMAPVKAITVEQQSLR